MSDKRKLIIITGPTAVGKSDLSIELAKRINGEIISADSMQIYKFMNIGTAKITSEEMQGIKHYLIDELDPSIDFNVYLFQEMAKKAMEEIYCKERIPIIVGGTGFYIQALLYDIAFTDTETDNSYRKELEEIALEKGADYLHNMLKEVDEQSAKDIHKNNIKRVIRALEYHKLTGDTISRHNVEQREKESPYDFLYYVINDDKEKLYERINLRVDKMIDAGLVKEVEGLVQKGYSLNNISMKGIGYKEIIGYLNNEYSLDEAIYIIKRDTRHFAKRQITWFKREKEVIWLNREIYHDSQAEMIDKIISDYKQLLQ